MGFKATADNRAYLAPCLRRSAQIPLRGTSDTRQPLYAIMEEERLVVRREQYPSKESENTFAIIKVK